MHTLVRSLAVRTDALRQVYLQQEGLTANVVRVYYLTYCGSPAWLLVQHALDKRHQVIAQVMNSGDSFTADSLVQFFLVLADERLT